MTPPGRTPPDPDPTIGAEAELVARARAGDDGAYRILVEGHRDRAYRLALRIVRSPGDAEEVAQDAFVRAWHALPGFRGEAAFGTWLHRIVCRLAFDRTRVLKTRALRESSRDADPRETKGAPVPEPPEEELRRRLERLVANLPEIQRAVISLYYFEDQSVHRTADVLGLNVNTVKTHLSRARAALREAWPRGQGE